MLASFLYVTASNVTNCMPCQHTQRYTDTDTPVQEPITLGVTPEGLGGFHRRGDREWVLVGGVVGCGFVRRNESILGLELEAGLQYLIRIHGNGGLNTHRGGSKFPQLHRRTMFCVLKSSNGLVTFLPVTNAVWCL